MQMRTVPLLVLRLSLCAAAAACGASQNGSAGAKTAEVAAPADGGSLEPGPPTTTTALGDGGDTTAVKLNEASSSRTATASSASSGGEAGHGAHGHEPGRSVADIRALVVAHRDEARACYDAALHDHPGIEGDLVVRWTIDPKGNVGDVTLDAERSQIAEPGVVSCISNIIKKIQFAASAGGYETKASYPFNFHPRRAQKSSAP